MPSARSGKRVDGEVAPLGVGAPVAAEGDARLAAEGFDVLAQRRHLDRLMLDDDGDGAVLDAGRDGLAAGRLTRRITSAGSAVVATSISATGSPKQRVAHGAADDARFLAVAIEQRKEPRNRAFVQPGRIA